MNRRGFLTLLPTVVTVAAVPELARTIFLPPRGGWPYMNRGADWADIGDFTTANMRYKSREYRYSSHASLSEHSLEEMLVEIKRKADALGTRLSIMPTHVIWTRGQ